MKVTIDYRMVLSRLGIKDYGKIADKKELTFHSLPKSISAKTARISFSLDENFLNKLEKLTVDALTFMEPKASFEFTEFTVQEDTVFLRKFNISFKSKNIIKILNGKSLIYIMACTLGEELGRHVSESDNVSDAFILDAIGSETVEVLANNVNRIIRQDAEMHGLPSLSMRFSPGYGDLNLNLQKDLLSIVNAQEIGITLTQTGLMYPQKSITALIGAGKI